MKLTKDQIQKIVLGGMMFFGVIYAYFTFLLTPLTTGREAALKEIEALGPKIDAARSQIAKTKAIEAKEPATRQLLAQVKALIPEGAPVAWFPTKLADHFKREGIDRVAVRMLSEAADKELPGFSRLAWAVEIPRVEFINLAVALAALENGEPLLEIHMLEIEAGRDDVQFQHALLTLNNLARL